MSPSALDELDKVTARDRAAWRRWLAEHHATSPGVWLILEKKGSGRPSLSSEEAGLEALCFGWIDSKRLPLDADRYRQAYTPRKPRSTWSRVNKERVERLISEGLMTDAGLAAIETARANGSWTSLDAVEALSIPDDLAAALAANPIARSNFDAYAPSVKKLALLRLTSAKRADTRSRRIDEIVRLAAPAGRARRPD
jgi:uncharacterized protein YdeI (YjbR/CyaY-like superfamily)